MPRTGPRVPSQRRARATRTALLEAGAREFSIRGYAAATSKTIAERAGVATGTFYQYFVDKDALLRELAAERMALLAAGTLGALEDESRLAAMEPTVAPGRDGTPDPALAARVRARLQRIAETVLDYHRADVGLHAVLTERRHADPELDALTSAAERALCARVATLLERWKHPGDAQATAFVLFGMVEGAVHAHVLGGNLVSDARLLAALVEALLRVALGHYANAASRRTR